MGCNPSKSTSPSPRESRSPEKFENEDNQLHLTDPRTNVDEDGAGRPARVDVQDQCRIRPRTGEEGQFELRDEDDGDGRLGITNEERIKGFFKLKAKVTLDNAAQTPIARSMRQIYLSRQFTNKRDRKIPFEIQTLLSELDEGELFEDPDFPAAPSSLFYSKRPESELNQFSWKRPFELAPDPDIYVNGTSRKDVIQGVLGDCWLLSTCAAVAKREDLLFRVIPKDQVLQGPDYTGLIRVRLWRYGQWETVFIDDRLPQKNKQYCYARCSDKNEFWVALIEKACAKLHGSYEAIEGGMPIEAMVDLTGGLAERYELKNPNMHKTLYRYLRRSFAAQAFITCSRKGDWRMAHKADQNGLVQGHAYTITGLYRVDAGHLGRVSLIRVRNPWGDANEWRGEWCDGHEHWNLVPEKTKRAMGLHNLFDGEFWMEFFGDFCREFEEVSICTLGPDFNHDGTVDTPEAMKVIFGSWEVGLSAGGCRNNLALFASNPQFLLRVHEADDHDETGNDHNAQDPKCQVIVSLAQEHRRSQRDKKVKLLQIGFCIYRAPDNSGQRLGERFFMYNYDVGTSGPYINYREVFARFELSPGDYVIIPATFEPDTHKKFMIRVYAGKRFDLKEMKN